jgi:protein tyrosine/serine phosphatase/predicted nucleotidyltransferase
MNPIIDRIAKKMEVCLKEIEIVEGVVYFGGYARNDCDFYSDLDIFIYLNDSHDLIDKDNVKGQLIELLKSDDEGISSDFEIYDKWIIFTKKTFIKVEIVIKSVMEATEDVIFIAESKIQDPTQAIAYDIHNKIKQIYEENWIHLNDDNRLKNLFIEYVYKFIYYFEGVVSNLAKDDEYKAYMNYTIAFYKLAGLKAIVEGEYFNLFQPRNFTPKIINNWNLRVKYYKASAGLRKYDMYNQRHNLISLFLSVLERGIEKFNYKNEMMTEIKHLIERFERKYAPFKNFRDISSLVNAFSTGKKIKSGLIYRSASLSKNDDETILKFLNKNQISSILDLRGKAELEKYIMYNNFYSEEMKERYVINIPFKTDVNNYIPNKPYINFYYAFLKDFREEFGLLFGKYFNNASENRLIIHCEGGKDRTGVIIALLLDILGIDRELILQDYLLSYSDTNREYIDFIFKILDEEYEGTENFLKNQCNVSEKAITNIKNVLVED